jgi:hypothetical protein
MICCGSASDFGKVLVPVLASVLDSFPDPDNIGQFQQQFFPLKNLDFSMPEAALFPRKLTPDCGFFDFLNSILC